MEKYLKIQEWKNHCDWVQLFSSTTYQRLFTKDVIKRGGGYHQTIIFSKSGLKIEKY